MQTFLPYEDYAKSFSVLDWRRLGKQRVEAWQILNTLKNGGAWRNHTAVKMWENYEVSLCEYGMLCCAEWRCRGYTDNLLVKFYDFYVEFLKDKPHVKPDWVGISDLHISHQSNLLRKDTLYYEDYFPNVRNDIPYWWPTKQTCKSILSTYIDKPIN